MLGRLNMSVEECQQAYTTLAEEVFGKPNNILAFRDGIFNAKTLEEVITRIVIEKKLGTKMMNSPDQRCKVFVSDSKKLLSHWLNSLGSFVPAQPRTPEVVGFFGHTTTTASKMTVKYGRLREPLQQLLSILKELKS